LFRNASPQFKGTEKRQIALQARGEVTNRSVNERPPGTQNIRSAGKEGQQLNHKQATSDRDAKKRAFGGRGGCKLAPPQP